MMKAWVILRWECKKVTWSRLFLRGCRRDFMVQGKIGCAFLDVSWLEVAVLMDKNEAWGSSLCFWVWHLPEGQGWLYEAWRDAATTKYSRIAVGWYKHGLPYGLTNDSSQVWFDLGDHRSTLQICPLYTRQHQLQSSKVCGNLHSSRVMLARSSEDNNLRLRFTVCRSLLRATAHVPRDSLNPRFNLSSVDWWPNWLSQLNPWRYAKSLCFGTSRKLG
jgi:hypothetical protein